MGHGTEWTARGQGVVTGGSPQEALDASPPGPKFASGDTTLSHRDGPLLGKLGSDADRRLMARTETHWLSPRCRFRCTNRQSRADRSPPSSRSLIQHSVTDPHMTRLCHEVKRFSEEGCSATTTYSGRMTHPFSEFGIAAGVVLLTAFTVATAAPVDIDPNPTALMQAMQGRRVVLLGEVHDNAAQHALRVGGIAPTGRQRSSPGDCI